MLRSIDYRTVSAMSDCRWSDVPGDSPILTDDQVATAIGSPVRFAGATPSLPNPYGPPVVGCDWTETTDPAVTVEVSEQDFASRSKAAAQYQTILSVVPSGGLVEANLKIDGHDGFLAQFNEGPALYILVDKRLVVASGPRWGGANAWSKPLTAIGSEVVARLQAGAISMHPRVPNDTGAAQCDLSRPSDQSSGSAAATAAIASGALADPGRLIDPVAGAMLGLADVNSEGNGAQYHNDGFWLVGFFDTLASGEQYPPLHGLLNAYAEDHLANDPSNPDALTPQYPTFYNALACALMTDRATKAFANSLLAFASGQLGPNTAQQEVLVKQLLAADPAAARGLFLPLTPKEIVSTPLQAVANYLRLAASALSATDPKSLPVEIGDAVPAPYGPLTPGQFSPAQAWALLLLAGDIDGAGQLSTPSYGPRIIPAQEGNPALLNAEDSFVARTVPGPDLPPGPALDAAYHSWAVGATAMYLINGLPTVALTYLHDGAIPGTCGGNATPTVACRDYVNEQALEALWESLTTPIEVDEPEIAAAEILTDDAQQKAEEKAWEEVGFDLTKHVLVTGSGQAYQALGPRDRANLGATCYVGILEFDANSELNAVIYQQRRSGIAVPSNLGEDVQATEQKLLGTILTTSGIQVPSQIPEQACEGQDLVVTTSAQFAPNSTVTITGHSTAPVVLGSAVAGPDGRVVALVRLPPSLAAGRHTIVAQGTGTNGKPLSISAPVDIVSLTPTANRRSGGSGTLVGIGATLLAGACSGLLVWGLRRRSARRRRRQRPTRSSDAGRTEGTPTRRP